MVLKHTMRKFQIPRFHRTLSFWVNEIVKAGFQIEEVIKPYPSEAQITESPSLHSATLVAYFLHIRVRKKDNCLVKDLC